LVCIDWNKAQNHLTFVRESENLTLPARRPEPIATSRAAEARSGRPVETPPATAQPEAAPADGPLVFLDAQ
jgi:hypothetical protein